MKITKYNKAWECNKCKVLFKLESINKGDKCPCCGNKKIRKVRLDEI